MHFPFSSERKKKSLERKIHVWAPKISQFSFFLEEVANKNSEIDDEGEAVNDKDCTSHVTSRGHNLIKKNHC